MVSIPASDPRHAITLLNATSDAEQADLTRFHAMDWLRCGAFLLLIWLHTATMFTSEGWHLQFAELPGVTTFLAICKPWRMELIFLVSGTALSYSLDRRGPLAFALQSCRRLLPPLMVGVILLIPPVFFFESIATDAPAALIAAYESGIARLAGGDLTWYIFWYLGYLLAFSIGLSLIWPTIRAAVNRIRVLELGSTGVTFAFLLILGLPFVAIEIVLAPLFPIRRNFVSDIASVASFGCIFMYGLSIFRNSNLLGHLARLLPAWAVLAITITVLALVYDGTDRTVADMLRGAQIWLTVCALVSVAARYFNWKSNRVVWFNSIVFPFYLLHQVAILTCAYALSTFLSGWPLLLATGAAACIVSIAISSYVIKPVKLLHIWFGIPKQRQSVQ